MRSAGRCALASKGVLRGMPFFEYVNTGTDLAEAFNNAMRAGSEFAIYAVLAAYDFGGYRTLVDVGGGHGRLRPRDAGRRRRQGAHAR